MWVKLSAIGKNPSIPMKFAYGMLQLGLGFLVVLVAVNFAEDYKVPLVTLVLLYMLHTTGELFISPIGLSMVTKLSPKKMAGTAMGAWFLSYAIGNFLAGKIAALTGGEGGSQITDMGEQLKVYTGVFSNIGFFIIGFAVVIAIFSKQLNKLMHGVR